MRRRRPVNHIESLINLDSLMDIVSNIVGMLVIIGVISGLNMGSKNYIYETPLAQATEKASVYFECNGDRLIPVDSDSTQYYTRIFIAHQQVLIPKAAGMGESRREIGRENSTFRKNLSTMDPDKEFLALFVRPDGFDTFRAVRKLAWENGFSVGWIPKPQFERIIFSPYGEQANVVE